MIVYYATHHDDLSEVQECPHRVCRVKGFSGPHLCFASEPLRGLGSVVFTADIPQALLAPYEYENDWRADTVRFYAVPRDVLAKYQLMKEDFEKITGTPWNYLKVNILDKTPRGRHLSEWSVVWMSGRGVAHGRIKDRTEVVTDIEIMTTVDFDPDKDYIVCETHEISKRTIGPPIKETWEQKVLAGLEPAWVLFPQQWKQWVFNSKVKDSAIEYILRHCPEAREAVEFAMQTTAKENKTRAWDRVARLIETSLQQKYGASATLGRLPGQSFTAVEAMPHRIASRLSAHLPYAAWEPPAPQPKYANPEVSGRVVLANPLGIHPTSGPGVDHKVSNRSQDGREGEEGPDRHPGSSNRVRK